MSKEFKKISIITPSYNQGRFIEETILSVIEQGYPNLEYIVLDGGSTDNTVDIIKKYEKYITFWKSERDKGQSDAINQGFRRATGEIINWLNSDDYYENGSLQNVNQAFQDDSVNVYCGRSRVFGKGKDYLSNGTDLYLDNLNKTIGWARIDQPETFFRHKALKELGYLNNFLHYTMDKEMWMRYLLKYGLSGIQKTSAVLVNYRLHETSKTVSMQKGFVAETHNLYYTYAKWFGLDRFSTVLEEKFAAQQFNLNGYESLLDKQNAYHIINYYFLQQALVNYAHNNFQHARAFIKAIDKSALPVQDSKELNKVCKRMKMPVALKKIFNLIKN
jgi:glycosyltransferase involved in cell wall biosynthesis